MHTTTASRQPELLSSESSDSDTEKESLFGPQPPGRCPWNNQPSQGSTVDPWGATNRPCDSPIRRGSDRELQAFISMRDQADQATEVRESVLFAYDITRDKGRGLNIHTGKSSSVSVCILSLDTKMSNKTESDTPFMVIWCLEMDVFKCIKSVNKCKGRALK